jgi:hypothetical protein
MRGLAGNPAAWRLVAAIALALAFGDHLRAQEGTAAVAGPQIGASTVHPLKIGMIITADGGICKGLVGTTPIPVEWPEQQVKVIGEEFSPFVEDVDYRMVGGTVKQMVVRVPFLPAGEKAEATVSLEITRSRVLPPGDPSLYRLPEKAKLDRQTHLYLGTSPGIETRHAKIRSLSREIIKEHEGAWQKVEALYDWVRENVEYKDGPFKGAMAALKDGEGDCEELTSLFIALCRAGDIPARTVWVPGHCYPEFYLVDEEGNGYWFPCQAAGTRDFGGIAEDRPILQKGDNFIAPERPKEQQRYLAEFLTGKGGKPRVTFLRQ